MNYEDECDRPSLSPITEAPKRQRNHWKQDQMDQRHLRTKYRDQLHSVEWRQFSDSIINARGECWNCSAIEALQVHHLIYRDVDLWDYEPHEVRVLCRDCHQAVHIVADLIWVQLLRFEPHQLETLLKRVSECSGWRECPCEERDVLQSVERIQLHQPR